jgi:hypothetical protein
MSAVSTAGSNAGGGHSGSLPPGPPLPKTKYRRLRPDEDAPAEQTVFNIVVMVRGAPPPSSLKHARTRQAAAMAAASS